MSKITPNVRSRRSFSPDFKLKVVKKAQELSNYVATAKEFNITDNSVRKWVKEYKEHGLDALLSKSSRPNYSPKKTSQWVIDKITKIKKEREEMGSKAMSEHLKRFESIDLSSTAIAKIFKKEGLCDGDAGYAKASYFVKGDKDKRLESTIEAELGEWERFARPNPNDLWQMDIMSFYIRDQHKVYLISALDDCSRYIINWGLFKEQTASNVLEVLRGALTKYGVPSEILTDQGAQFKHWKGVTQFEKILKKLKIQHIKARSHHPQTCGKIERFHGTLNQKAFRYGFYPNQTIDQLQYKLNLFMHYYNFNKKHRGLGMDGKTPIERLNELSSVNLTLQCHNH